jgi:hypothetical protein
MRSVVSAPTRFFRAAGPRSKDATDGYGEVADNTGKVVSDEWREKSRFLAAVWDDGQATRRDEGQHHRRSGFPGEKAKLSGRVKFLLHLAFRSGYN